MIATNFVLAAPFFSSLFLSLWHTQLYTHTRLSFLSSHLLSASLQCASIPLLLAHNTVLCSRMLNLFADLLPCSLPICPVFLFLLPFSSSCDWLWLCLVWLCIFYLQVFKTMLIEWQICWAYILTAFHVGYPYTMRHYIPGSPAFAFSSVYVCTRERQCVCVCVETKQRNRERKRNSMRPHTYGWAPCHCMWVCFVAAVSTGRFCFGCWLPLDLPLNENMKG